MAENQVIVVPAPLDQLGLWIDATFLYMRAFPGVTVSNVVTSQNLALANVVSIVGAQAEWQRDIVSEVKVAAPHATIDQIVAKTFSELRTVLEQRIASGLRYGVQASEGPKPFRLRWPTEYPNVNQLFAARPEYYGQFGLPGHEGLDIRCPDGGKLFACADGEVTEVVKVPDGKPYGARVRLKHISSDGVEWETTYAHMRTGTPVVSVGQKVKEGEFLGEGDNTGNSAGSHLHLTLKKKGATAAGETKFPRDIVDPTPYLFWPDLHLTSKENGMNVRQQPSTDSAVVDIIDVGEAMEPLDLHAEVLYALTAKRWIKVRTNMGIEGYVMAVNCKILPATDSQAQAFSVQSTVTIPTGRLLFGIHGRADQGRMLPADFEVIRASKIEAVKLLTTNPVEDLHDCRAINPNMFIMVRLFENYGTTEAPRNISADQFANKFKPNPAGHGPTDLQRFYDAGVRYFEVHNEPNLRLEGYNGTWNNGKEFGDWFLRVMEVLRGWYPEAKWGFPGMSPGPVCPPRPQEMWHFLDQARHAVSKADWLGIHQYFADVAEMDRDLDAIVRRYRTQFPEKFVMITEFSNPKSDVAKMVKGQQYVAYMKKLKEIPGVAAAFSYLLSGSGWSHEAWRDENGAHSPIVTLVAERKI